MITLTFDASWWLVLVFVFDLVVRVARDHRRPAQPSADFGHGLAAGDLLHPAHRRLPVPADRQPAPAAQAPPQAGAHQRVHPRHQRAPRLRHAAPARPGVVHLAGDAEPQPRRHAARRRQRRAPHPRLPGEPRCDGGRHPRRPSATCTSSSTSCRRMPRPTTSSGRWKRSAARGVTVRVLLDHWANRRQAVLPQDAQAAQRHGRAVAADAARPAVQGQVPAPRPAQPPEAARRRRHGRVHGLAERHRLDVQPAEEHQARPALGRPHGARARVRSSRPSTPCSSPTGTARPTRC